jgi:hypothetical protein
MKGCDGLQELGNVFYCPKCKMLEVNFKFDKWKQRDQITWSNPRDGYGRHITHIYCPSCKYELSGFIFTSGMWQRDDPDDYNTDYIKSVIEGYSDGSYCDTEKLLGLIRRDKSKQ